MNINSIKYILLTDHRHNSTALYIFILLFTCYFSQGILYPSGSVLSQFFLFCILFWGGYSLFRTIQFRNKPTVVRLFTIFTLLLLITYLISPKTVNGTVIEFIGKVNTFGQFKNEMSFCLMFFIGYQIVPKTVTSNNTFLYIAFVLTFLSIVNYIHTSNQLARLFNRDENTISTAYNFISLLPIYALSFKNHRKLSLLLMIVCMFYVIQGAKRGAIVCMIMCVLVSFIWYIKNFKLSVSKRLLSAILILGIGAIAAYWYGQNEYLISRIEYMEARGIGYREIGYEMMLNHWLNDSNFITQLFGNGTAQTINVWGNYGHNDWLELLIDNGILGVILYAIVFISAFNFIFKKIESPYIRLSAFLCVMIWFLKTIFSMGYTDQFSGIMTFILGFCIRKTTQKMTLSLNNH